MNKYSRIIRKAGQSIVVIAGTAVITAGNALATPPASIVDVSAVTVDTTMLGTVGALIAAALGGLWGWRKFVKSINRS